MKRGKLNLSKAIDWLKHYSPLEESTAKSRTTTTTRTTGKPSFSYRGLPNSHNHQNTDSNRHDNNNNNITYNNSNDNNNIVNKPKRATVQRFVIYWFRLQDLRLRDHPALSHACRLVERTFDDENCHLIPVFCFDRNIFYGNRSNNSNHTNNTNTNNTNTNNNNTDDINPMLKCGPRRAKFILESVRDLRQQLQQHCHSQLVVGYNTTYPQFFHKLISDLKDYYTQLHEEHQRYRQNYAHRQHHINNTNNNNNNNNNNNDDEGTELQFDISIVCQEEPVREERMQVVQVSKVLLQHNNPSHSNRSDPHNDHDHDDDYEALWQRITSPSPQHLPSPSLSHWSNPKIVQPIWGSTLRLPRHLSMSKSFHDMPDLFGEFAKKIRRNKIHDPYDPPQDHYRMPFPVNVYPQPTQKNATNNNNNNSIDDKDSNNWMDNIGTEDETATSNPHSFPYNPLTYLPTLQDLGYTAEQIASTEQHHPHSRAKGVVGGETAGLQRMQEYIWDLDLLKHWSNMRQQPILENQSTLLSPYLAHGCLSPRTIAAEANRLYAERQAPRARVILQHELQMRDYNKLYCIKHGDGIFQKYGALPPNKRDVHPRSFFTTDHDFTMWKTGRTGYPLVDATMREIYHSGYASYIGRLNAASFLVYDMQHDWRRGAQYFEEQLIDYDVYLNWWAWCNVAGFATGKVFPRCVIAHDGKKYDPMGQYVKQWIPELQRVPPEFIHEPWNMNDAQQDEYNVRLGIDYPNPCIDPNIGEERRQRRAQKRNWIRDTKLLNRNGKGHDRRHSSRLFK